MQRSKSHLQRSKSHCSEAEQSSSTPWSGSNLPRGNFLPHSSHSQAVSIQESNLRHLPIQSYTNFIMETKYSWVQNHKKSNSQKRISLKTVCHQSENTSSCFQSLYLLEHQNMQGYRWEILFYTCSALMLSISSCWGSLSEMDCSYKDLFFEPLSPFLHKFYLFSPKKYLYNINLQMLHIFPM